MSRRAFAVTFAVGFGSAGLLAAGLFLGSALAPRPADAGPKAEAKPLRAGHVCLSELMRDYTKWQERTRELNGKRAEAAKKLTAMQEVIAAGGRQAEAAAGDEKTKLTNALFEARRKFEDAERGYRAEFDKDAADHVKELYADIAAVIRTLADEYGLDAVYGYPGHPERVMAQHRGSEHVAIEMLLRPPAMLPLYLRDSTDLTEEAVGRLNAKHDREK